MVFAEKPFDDLLVHGTPHNRYSESAQVGFGRTRLATNDVANPHVPGRSPSLVYLELASTPTDSANHLVADLDPNLLRNPVQTLLWVYAQGAFPMADSRDPDEPLRWFSPDPRAILPLRESDGLHIPRRLRDRVRQRPFLLTTDLAFEDVMRQCARPRPGESETWIDERLINAYTALHRAGHAHSIEAWLDDDVQGDVEQRDAVCREHGDARLVLIGGVYGVHIGSAFMAESMFHRADLGGTDASKICLLALAHHLDARGFTLCDTQFVNPHIAQFGVREIPLEDYLLNLREAIGRETPWLPFAINDHTSKR